MAIGRYTRSPVLRGGQQFGTSNTGQVIKKAVDEGRLSVTVRVLQGAERLDILAGQIYLDSSQWWIIAAASGIGWGLQVPPGTRIVIPTNLAEIAALVG